MMMMMMMMMTKATTLSWGKHGMRRVRVRRASVRRVTRVSLSHSQRDLVAQEVGVMYQVSYSSSVSTFCRNEMKDRNYKSIQQHIFISFSFSGKKWLAPFMLDVIFAGNLTQPPLNHKGRYTLFILHWFGFNTLCFVLLFQFNKYSQQLQNSPLPSIPLELYKLVNPIFHMKFGKRDTISQLSSIFSFSLFQLDN